MEVSFYDPKFQKLAESENRLRQKFGEKDARKLQQRFTDLRSADVASDLAHMPGRWHLLSGDLRESWAANVGHPRRIVVAATPPVPRGPDGGVEWWAVTAVTVIGVLDYH